MPDREKIIDALKEAGVYFRSSFDAMYGTVACEKFRNWTDAIEQAIALLKAQEPVEPKMMEFVDKGLTWEKYGVPTCGVCGALLGDALFCPMCGRGAKWE